MQYWISDGVQQFGPFPLDQLRAHGLRPHWLVWNEDLPNWTTASQIPQIQALFDDPPADAPPREPGAGAAAAAAHPNPIGYAGPARTSLPGYAYRPQADLPQTMAIVSLVLGIVGFTGIPTSILAVIFGHIALSRINRGEEGGKGMAIAGLVLGYVGLAGMVAALLIFGLFFCAMPFALGW